MPVELSDTATHDEVQEFVDQIVEDRKGEEEKSDAQKVAEDHNETAVVEVDSDTGKKTAGDGEVESQDQDWLDDELKSEVAAYGIDEKELADFTSREEVERALRFFDRSALEAGRKAMAEGEKSGRKKEPEAEPKEGTEPKEDRYEVALDKDIHDEDLIGEFTRMRDHYESRVAALEARFTEVDTRAEEQQFDSLVDSLGHADLFGKSGKEKGKELQRREDLFVAVKAQQIGLQHLGRPADLDESLVNRVARMVFAEELSKKDLKARTRKISKQSDNRMGGSATKAHEPAEPLKDEMRQLYKELDGAG